MTRNYKTIADPMLVLTTSTCSRGSFGPVNVLKDWKYPIVEVIFHKNDMQFIHVNDSLHTNRRKPVISC